MTQLRPVRVTGVGLICPAGIGLEGSRGGRPGEVPGFEGRAYIQNRKNLKLMTRAVQLGVSAVRLALTEDASWENVRPERRGLFVGSSPQTGDPDDLRPALAAAIGPQGRFELGRFATEGIPLIHPLWLVRGLSNNVLGFASAIHDLQGVNMNYCHGEEGGWLALQEGFWAVAEGRADLVVAGGADSLVEIAPLLGGRKCGEGAAFVVFAVDSDERGPNGGFQLDRTRLTADEHHLGFLGAATWPVALARELLLERHMGAS
jgi:3-oxoacyl-[acyl-carrier-protein] synthase II